jgi:L-asparaginase / beta-aspartyl-peptidase
VIGARDWALAIHGGAKPIAPEERDANREGLAEAYAQARAVLEGGGTALAAVEAAIRVLESRPVFNAGYGSSLTTDGEVEMCAAVMDGRMLGVGAVAAVQGVRHPVSVAARLLGERWVLLAGDGARRFAAEAGLELCPPEAMISQDQREAAHDTVGAVALDRHGNIAAGTSTGGLDGQPPGRMGDSALPGGGYYADNHEGAVALSGDGEALARLAASARVMALLPDLGPEDALRRVLERVPHLGGDAGGIALTKAGRIGWWHNSPAFAVATGDSAAPSPRIFLGKDEL